MFIGVYSCLDGGPPLGELLCHCSSPSVQPYVTLCNSHTYICSKGRGHMNCMLRYILSVQNVPNMPLSCHTLSWLKVCSDQCTDYAPFYLPPLLAEPSPLVFCSRSCLCPLLNFLTLKTRPRCQENNLGNNYILHSVSPPSIMGFIDRGMSKWMFVENIHWITWCSL